jgi:predicted ribosomally synthesized peptide with SipW-like signal peptide
MKALLMSLMVIALVGGLVGGGLFAHFSDTETSEGNTFTAGTLDLTVDGTNELPSEDVENMKPCCWVKWEEHQLLNVGSLAGVLTAHLEITDEGGGANPEPEGPNNSDLPDLLDVVIVYCYPDNVLHLVEGAQTWQEAVAKLAAAGIVAEVKAAGKLRDLACTPILLDDVMDPQEGSLFQVLVHLEQDNAAQGDYAVVTKTLKLVQTECE